MRHTPSLLCGFALLTATAFPAQAARERWERPTTFDRKIEELCRKHGVPERLVHRVIMRESRYRAEAVSKGNYGLMQIRYGTARSMGYTGTPDGLRHGETNLTYAVPYLANAYAVAGRDEDRAVRLYASGFYYTAKQQGMLARLRTGGSGGPDMPTGVATAPVNPLATLFGAFSAPAQAAVDAAAAESDANLRTMAADSRESNALAGEDDGFADVPVPPRRPRAYSTKAFLKLAMNR